MPIRWRLTLWFSGVLLIILVFSGFILYFILQRYLYNSIDNDLTDVTARVQSAVNGSGSTDSQVLLSRLPPLLEFASPTTYIELIDASGKILVKSENLGSQELPVSPTLIETSLAGGKEVQNVSAGAGTEVRIMASQLKLSDQTLILETARSTQPVTEALQQFRLALLISTLTALVLTAISGAILINHTLGPVKRITATAKSIKDSSNLERRVAYQGPGDEIGQLASTFDEMIESLHKVFASQKQFVEDASHELRTPLTVIRGNLDLLKRNLGEADRQESVRAIDKETGRMIKIVNDLLVLAEVETGRESKPEKIVLKPLILEEVERARLGAGSRKIAAGHLDDVEAWGERHRLSQVLSNLLDNAVKYTPEEGTITISAYSDPEWVRLEVSDTGIGITEADLPHIFDRFYRVDKARSRASGGSGLGLAIAREIIEGYGGKITVASEPGKGSLFTVWLKNKNFSNLSV